MPDDFTRQWGTPRSQWVNHSLEHYVPLRTVPTIVTAHLKILRFPIGGSYQYSNIYWVASMAITVGKWVGFVRFLFLFFSVLRKVSPITPLLSGVFVRGVFRAYFGRISGGSRKA